MLSSALADMCQFSMVTSDKDDVTDCQKQVPDKSYVVKMGKTIIKTR